MTDASISLEAVIDAFAARRILVVGDVMLDRFVYGEVRRISPEAPVPVIRAEPAEETVGGAGNVACNIAALGAACDLVGLVGTDEAGEALARRLAASPAVAAGLIACASRCTTLKTRFVATPHGTHMLRADREDAGPLDRDLEDRVIARALERLGAADALVLSDYAKGVLSSRVLAQLVAAARSAGTPVIVDPKGFDFTRYAGADVLTPNVQELGQALGRAIADTQEDIAAAARTLIERLACAALVVTRGARGALLVERDGPATHFPASARRVADVSGAGDTVAAGFALALAAGAGYVTAARIANAAAGLAVAERGTAQVSAADLREAVLSRPRFDVRAKIAPDAEACAALARGWRREGLTVGFTNGCFDLLHPGHIALLAGARARCDRLIVGLNGDASVARLKGPARPVQPEAARATVLAALMMVDAVVLFDEDTPLTLIAHLRPDLLVKGADYRLDQVVGRDLVEADGGRVVLVDLMPETSTTRIVAAIEEGRDRARPERRPIPAHHADGRDDRS